MCCLESVNKFLSRLQLCLDWSVKACSTVVKYLDSWYVGDPQNETIGRGMFGLCSVGSPYSLSGCGTGHLSL